MARGGSRMAPLALVVLLLAACVGAQPLAVDFYKTSCPDVAAIIKRAAQARFNQDPFAIPSVIRLVSHDALVGNGVDGSVLNTEPGSEQTAADNVDLAPNGFDAITAIKAAVEAQCPRVVSCADILAAASKEMSVLAGGPSWEVRFGRRDSLVSSAQNVDLPGGDASLDEIIRIFGKLGLSVADIVALSGAHTIGFAHCHSIVNRLYNFNSTTKLDPSLDKSLAQDLQGTCPPKFDPDVVVPLDPNTDSRFDRVYYKNLRVGQGVLHSDQILSTDRRTKALVVKFSKNTQVFFKAFGDAMVKLSEANVLTGSQGEVRVDCSRFNSQSPTPKPASTPKPKKKKSHKSKKSSKPK